MAGLSVATNEIPPYLQLYLICCPGLDLNYRFLPRAGGYYDQDYVDMAYFSIIEQRVKEILHRKEQQERRHAGK